MADTKISALTAASAAALANEFAINEAGTSKKVTLQQIMNAIDLLAAAGALADANTFPLVQSGVAKEVDLNTLVAYIEQRARQTNGSVANQTTITGNADVYVVGSDVAIPANRLQAKSMYRMRMNIVKTAAGAGAPAVSVRIGTAGTTADAQRALLTFGSQTAAIDEAMLEITVTFRTVGSGTTAVIVAVGEMRKRLLAAVGTGATGLGPTPIQVIGGIVSAGFDSTVANLKIGVSINAGASSAWTVHMVQAELFNLA